MKFKSTKTLTNLYKRIFVRNREHVGIKTSYNLYRMHPFLRLISKGNFMQDESERFPEWVEKLRKRGYKKVLILGNAPCLNEMSQDLFEKIQSSDYLTIGLNRSIYMFQTDILVWTDLLTIDDILKKRAVKSNDTTLLHVRLERDHRLPAAKDKGFHKLHKFWNKNRSFAAWTKPKLFMFRNSAVAALHLCHKLDIKEVLMVGFGFENREYFYKTDKYEGVKAYEIISSEKLDKNCGGYDTQRIIREVLEYLENSEKFDISYNGNSSFLATIPGLKRVDLNEWARANLSPD